MTGLIPKPFIEELLSRTDIVEFIDGYVPLKKQGTSYTARCPFHNENTPSFNVVSKKQYYHCFGCGVSGNAISFAMNYLHQGFADAIETLATRMGMQVPREGHVAKSSPSPSLYQLLERAATFYQTTLKTSAPEAVTYLKQRGVQGEVASLYQLGYAPEGWHTLEAHFRQEKLGLIATGMLIQKEDGKTYDRYRQRVMFPIHDQQGRIIGFGGRAIGADQKPKYLNSPETTIFQKGRELYGLYQVLQQHNTVAQILVVEGYMDVIALAQHGITHAVATLGTATSTFHIQRLSKYTKQLVFCFDGDAAGRKAAWRALESSLSHLNAGLDARFIFLPEGHDPDSLVREEGKEAFLLRIEQAMPLHQFFFETLTRDVDTKSLPGKSQLLNAAKPYLVKIPEGSYKQLLLDEMTRITHIEQHRIDQFIADKALEPSYGTGKSIARTPIRVAIGLLLQHPDIYAMAESKLSALTLASLNQPVLQALMATLKQHPTMSTAMLVELFRDSDWYDSLNKLVVWEHQVPNEQLVKEFVDTVHFLAKQKNETKIQQWIEKARTQGLNETERMALQDLLKQRHKNE